MNRIARAKEILLTPGSFWPAIDAEEESPARLFTQYLMPLAAIPAVAGFVGMSLIGVGGFGVSIRIPIPTALVQMVLGYALSLALVYAMSLIADAMAPGFGGQRNRMKAMKLMVYSSTAAMAGGIFVLVPPLGVLMLVAGIYSLYLLFRGVPTLMRVPTEKVLPYTAILSVCAIGLSVIASMLLGAVQGGPASIASLGTGSGMGTPASQIAIDTPKGIVKVDTAGMEAWSKRMEAVGETLEKAQRSGDQAAMERAFKELEEMQKESPRAK